MLMFIVGMVSGMIAMLILYSAIAAETISTLQNENARLTDDIQRLEYDLHKARYVYTMYKDENNDIHTKLKNGVE